MGHYHTAQICRNGHVINTSADRYPQSNENFCSKCGVSTITRCEKCNEPIRGYYEVPGVIGFDSYERPSFCHKCGAPYPWTLSALESAKALATTLDQLSEKERQELEQSLDDLVRDTPRTKVAEIKFKQIMKKVGADVYEGMRGILIQVVSETVRKSLFGI